MSAMKNVFNAIILIEGYSKRVFFTMLTAVVFCINILFASLSSGRLLFMTISIFVLGTYILVLFLRVGI